jgi:hypothetical protein
MCFGVDGGVVAKSENVRRNIVISRDLDLRLRKAVLERTGLEKGDLSEAISEAIELWLKKHA